MTTIGKKGQLDKELVAHALKGELTVGETEDGWEYGAAPKEECDRFVLEVLDWWVCQCKELADSGRAMEAVMDRHGFKMPFQEYIEEHARATREYDDYVTEADYDEWEDA